MPFNGYQLNAFQWVSFEERVLHFYKLQSVEETTIAPKRLSSCAINSHLIPITIFRDSKGWDSESAIFNRWCLLPMMAFNTVISEVPVQLIYILDYIVACQRGGVSSKPPVLEAATRHGPLTL